MPRPIPPYPSSEVEYQVAAPLLADLDARDKFANLLDPAAWTLELLKARRDGVLTRQHLMHVLVWLIATLRIPNKWDHWAVLAAADTLGRIDTTGLTHTTLRELIRHTATLDSLTSGRVITDLPKLRLAVESRKTAIRSAAGPAAEPFLPFLDRVREALTPLLRL